MPIASVSKCAASVRMARLPDRMPPATSTVRNRRIRPAVQESFHLACWKVGSVSWSQLHHLPRSAPPILFLDFTFCKTDLASLLLTWVLSASFSFVTTCSGHSASCITAWDVRSASLPALVAVFLGSHVHPSPILGYCARRSNPRPIQRRACLTVGIFIARPEGKVRTKRRFFHPSNQT